MVDSKKLKNDDFRKLISQTTSSQHSNFAGKKPSQTSHHAFTHRKNATTANGQHKNEKKKKHNYNYNTSRDGGENEGREEDDIFDESEARLNEILKNYRDRAAERRKGVTTDETNIAAKLTEDYKLHTSVLESSSLEAKMLEIQKSKYLGGDIEHTHLVKGLDYSLLNKVRTEIQEEQNAEKSNHLKSSDDLAKKREEMTQTGNRLARNVCKILFESKLPRRNEYFARGRMAYLVDLDEEESDVPSTLLRSVYDTQMDQSNENINADNVLINKLSQVLAYLRTDTKKKKRDPEQSETKINDYTRNKIFEGLDDYKPSKEIRRREDRVDKRKDGDYKSEQKSYFDSGIDDKRKKDDELRRRDERRLERKREPQKVDEMSKNDNLEKLKKRKLEQEDAYAELYPGGAGIIDAVGESDDDDDYTKMDQGYRKASIKRWDFDSQEDYERYQNSRESNPRAAYQFGVKTSGGRKTRKNVNAANERKIDRELDKINKILEKGVNKNVRF